MTFSVIFIISPCKEDFLEGESYAISHHLPLVALAAVEQQHLTFSLHGEPGNIAIQRRDGGPGAEEGES